MSKEKEIRASADTDTKKDGGPTFDIWLSSLPNSKPLDLDAVEESAKELKQAESDKSTDIGQLIHTRRLQRGLTMREVAESCGVAEGTISRWEHGSIQNMRRNNITVLSKILGIPVWQLMGWKDEDNSMAAAGNYFSVPVLERISPNVPISVAQNKTGTITLSSTDYTKPTSEYFGFRVIDESMSPDIRKNDILICHTQKQFQNGAYVIISIDGADAICRKIKIFTNGIALLSPTDDPLIFTTAEIKSLHLKIIGVVMEVRRILQRDD